MHSFNSINKGSFDLKINIPTKEFQISGYFVKSGSSIYAHLNQDEIKLVAGSQDKDEKRAMLKALFRVINLLELNLMQSENLKDEKLNAFKSFLDNHKRSKLHLDDDENIPVFSEEIRSSENGLSIQSVFKGTVTNLDKIHQSFPDQIQENIVSTLEESRVRISGTNSYQYRELLQTV
ncbi:MAG: hypothetical protein O9346_11745 [Leptospiraceae bacterium]|jgi:hypothetical protein|nr:hypothetical protein [Leptospiraceae bacterium]MCZ8347083.1 hypothetical protein [Leptospiraceae bacterium]